MKTNFFLLIFFLTLFTSSYSQDNSNESFKSYKSVNDEGKLIKSIKKDGSIFTFFETYNSKGKKQFWVEKLNGNLEELNAIKLFSFNFEINEVFELKNNIGISYFDMEKKPFSLKVKIFDLENFSFLKKEESIINVSSGDVNDVSGNTKFLINVSKNKELFSIFHSKIKKRLPYDGSFLKVYNENNELQYERNSFFAGLDKSAIARFFGEGALSNKGKFYIGYVYGKMFTSFNHTYKIMSFEKDKTTFSEATENMIVDFRQILYNIHFKIKLHNENLFIYSIGKYEYHHVDYTKIKNPLLRVAKLSEDGKSFKYSETQLLHSGSSEIFEESNLAIKSIDFDNNNNTVFSFEQLSHFKVDFGNSTRIDKLNKNIIIVKTDVNLKILWTNVLEKEKMFFDSFSCNIDKDNNISFIYSTHEKAKNKKLTYSKPDGTLVKKIYNGKTGELIKNSIIAEDNETIFNTGGIEYYDDCFLINNGTSTLLFE